MRSCKALLGPFLISSLAVTCFASFLQGATEESLSTATTATTTTTQSAPAGQGSNTNQPSLTSSSTNLGGGLYSRLPFQLSVTLSGGYDDNVSTTKDAQASSFTSLGATLNYDFSG